MARKHADTLTHTVNGIALELSRPKLDLLRLSCGRRCWLRPESKGGLWQLLVADKSGRRAVLTPQNAKEAHAAREGHALHLLWRGIKDPATGAGPFHVAVEMRPLPGRPNATAWRIAVDNPTRTWTLWHVEFPRLEGLAGPADLQRAAQFYADCWGAEYRGRAMHAFNLRYPRGIKITMQYFGYTRGRRTLYLGVHDPRLTTKDVAFIPPGAGRASGRMAVTTYPENMTLPGNSFAPEYDTVVADLAGDWYDASQLYATWARRQAWAAAPPAEASREPRSEREVHAWLCFSVQDKPPDTWANLAERLARRLGVRIGAHLYRWHETPFDTNYPDYFPARRGFKRLVSRLKRAGIVTMPYINGRLWDINAPSWRRRGALRYAAKQSAERATPRTLLPYLEEYGNGQKLAPMCPTTPFWRRTVVGICRRIVRDLGCDGVYLDQVAAERAELCFDPTHGHPLGGGGFWLEGYRRLMRQLRRAIGPGPILTTEANWEGCAADYDALLSYHRFGDEMVPMFPAVYAGLARTFGCAFGPRHIAADGGEPFACRMALLLAWGGQLGWGDLTPLLKPANRAVCDYFKTLCRMRAAHVDLFAGGRMLRPPRVTVLAGSPRHLVGRYPVYCSLWAAGPGGPLTCFVINPRRRAQRVRVTLADPACRGCKPARSAGVRLRSAGPGRVEMTLRLPPFGVRAIELRKP